MKLLPNAVVSFALIVFLAVGCFPVHVFAQAGRHGPGFVVSTVVFNEYTTLTSNATAGATTISVANSSLNSNAIFPSPLAAGELVFIVQMQGATITTPDDTTYGTISAYGNCGNYELAEVAGVPTGTSITLTCALQNNYSASGHTQVIRVPRFTSLTINSGGTITCPAWDGTTGGVVVLETSSTVTVNSGGSIDASGKGFRAGLVLDNLAIWGVLNYRYTTADYGAEKGESIAGDKIVYDSNGGRYCKGAPANGGGGANSHNGGGGGGANAGIIANWNGRGVPDISTASWASAWNLEYSGFATSNGSGGGKGGYTFSASNQDALTIGPFNAAWGGDQRRDGGGRGGRPLDYSGLKMYMGGGGGAGDQNDNHAGAGGAGGGLIYIFSQGNISGAGTIRSNGANGGNTIGSNGTDGAGGGGGGGAIVLNSLGTVSGITVTANGGNGGNQVVSAFVTEAEGPGGGGGGGYIAVSSGAPTRSANGGANGTTNSYGLTEFPPNGATRGGTGTPNATIQNFKINPSSAVVCGGSPATISFTTQGTVPSGTVFTWYNQAVGGTALGTGTTFTTPALFSNTVYYVSMCPGHYRVAIPVSVDLVTVSATASTVCQGSSTSFTGSASSAGTIQSWHWDFGDGSGTSNSQNPGYTYVNSGSYTATITATDNFGCTGSASQAVTVQATPVINFSPSAASGCGSLAVTFSNTTTQATSYNWNFGDGSPASLVAAPSHTYSTPGTYSVTLTASNSGCTSTVTQTNLIHVYPKPIASYNSATAVCLGDTVFFSNGSNGNGGVITGYSWNFGDGSPASVLQNPFHVYTSPGTYQAVLTVATANCTDDTTRSIQVNPSPLVNFSATTVTGCGNLNAVFNNTTTGAPVYSWNFGDGSPLSSSSNPVHNYNLPGTYTVTLIATQGSCADTLTRPAYITVYPQPVAAFTSSGNVCLGDTVFFTDASVSNGAVITGHSWNFGDGSPSSNQSNPYHVYQNAGTYPVTLTVSSANCQDDSVLMVSVNPSPQVAFSAPVTSGCGSLNVNFVNSTTGSPTFLWNFGDGSPVSVLTNPSHTYAPGTYTVTLIATQGSCGDTLSQASFVSVFPQPLAAFTGSSSTVCLGDTISFTNTSAGNGSTITGYSWNFGDGSPLSNQNNPSHVFGSSGTFSVTLTANSANCSDDTTVMFSVAPAPVVSFSAPVVSGCGTTTIQFQNNTSGSPVYSWDFGDGTSGSSAVNPNHTYSNPGQYTVVLTAVQGSCSDADTLINYIRIFPQPQAAFSAPGVCLGDTVIFTDLSTGNGATLVSHQWDFGDGTPLSNLVSPHHLYSGAGTFTVHLSVNTADCSDDTSLTVTVGPAPVVQFSPSVTSGCGPLDVLFNNSTSGSPVYFWDFGDGNNSSLTNPTHTYTAPGTYTVTLIASQGSCGDTLRKTNLVTVHPSPVAAFSMTSPCFGDSVRFTNTSLANGTTITGYQWNFGDGSPTNSGFSPGHFYSAPGTYTVSLIVLSGNGCPDTLVQQVSVLPAPTIAFTPDVTSGCDSLTVTFTNTTSGAGTYQWSFGDGSISSDVSPVHHYSSPGTYTVLLSATATGGCSVSRAYVNLITVHSSPVAGFVAGNTSVCPGTCIGFTDLSGSGITSWSWSFPGANPSSAAIQNPASVCYPDTGTYPVTLTVSNGFCSDSHTEGSYMHVVNCSALPVANFISSDTGLCGGSCVSFVSLSLNATSWQWSFPGAVPASSTLENPVNICYSSTGNHSVTLIAGNASGYDTLQLAGFIQVFPAPVTPSFSQTGNVLTSTPAAAYQWYLNGVPVSGANAQQFTATLPGDYAVLITDANGCTALSASKYVTIVGIQEFAKSPIVYLFPNPVRETLHLLSSNTTPGNYIFTIYDALGRQVNRSVFHLDLSDTDTAIPCGNLSAGAYLIRVENEDFVLTRSFLKQ